MSFCESLSLSQRKGGWEALAQEVLDGKLISRDEALSILEAPDTEILSLLSAAFKIRETFFGKKVKLNVLINAKSGRCPEDCGYCSQSAHVTTDIEKYSLVDKKTLIEGARRAWELHAGTYCIVASGRGPREEELEQICEAVQEIKARYPLKICTCLGILKEGQAEKLKAAGVDRYNHNLNTSEAYYPQVTTTHHYQDRVVTVERVKKSGISPCSGCIVGMGESAQDVLDVAFALRKLGADSIPVNFLHPIPGTPLGEKGTASLLTPLFCLKVLALFRFICPDKEIRVAGGRELHLRWLQPLALYAANSIFLGDYLTTKGQFPEADYRMIQDLGFEIEWDNVHESKEETKQKGGSL